MCWHYSDENWLLGQLNSIISDSRLTEIFVFITCMVPTVWGSLGTNQHCLRYLPAHQGGDWNGSCSHFHWAAELWVRGCAGAGKNQQDMKHIIIYHKTVFKFYLFEMCSLNQMIACSPGLTMEECYFFTCKDCQIGDAIFTAFYFWIFRLFSSIYYLEFVLASYDH